VTGGQSESDPGLLAGEPLDLRLVVPAGCAWATAMVGDASRPVISVAVSGFLATLGVLCFFVLRRPAAFVAAAAAWCAAGALLAAGWSSAAAVRGPLPALAARHTAVTLELVVTGDPHQSAASVGSARPIEVMTARAVAVISAEAITRIRSPVVLLASGDLWAELQPSQRLRATGRLSAASGGEQVAAVFDARGDPSGLTEPSRVQRVAGRFRAGLRSAAGPLSAGPRGLLPGLVDGDTSQLQPALRTAFQTTGLTHIVAVSGANVAIVLGAVLLLARWVGLQHRAQAVAGILAIVGFVVVARPEASVLRAAAMGLIAVVALATGRRRRALPSLCAAVLLLVLTDPALATSAGFALSVLATGGLVVLAPVLRERLSRWWPRWLAEAVSVPAAATLVCAPIIVMISGQVSLSSVPANLLAEPAVAPATVLGVLAACTAPVALPVAQLFARLGGVPCSWLILIARTFARIPGSAVRWPSGVRGAVLLVLVMAALFVGVLLWRARLGSAGRPFLAGVLAVALVIGGDRWWQRYASHWPPHGWVVAACAVGKGLALAIRAGPDSALLVDAGPAGPLIDGCLQNLGVRQLPVVVLTDGTASDVDGLGGALAGRMVGRVEAAADVGADDEVSLALAVANVGLNPAVDGSVGSVSWQFEQQAGLDSAVRFEVGGVSVLVPLGDAVVSGERPAQVLVLSGDLANVLPGSLLAGVRPGVVVRSGSSASAADRSLAIVLDGGVLREASAPDGLGRS
jgi:competence protein ComEC